MTADQDVEAGQGRWLDGEGGIVYREGVEADAYQPEHMTAAKANGLEAEVKAAKAELENCGKVWLERWTKTDLELGDVQTTATRYKQALEEIIDRNSMSWLQYTEKYGLVYENYLSSRDIARKALAEQTETAGNDK